MRVAILGDSSIACLKEGVIKNPRMRGLCDLVFFGGPSKTMRGLVVEDGVLVANNKRLKNFLSVTSNSTFDQLNPKDYDAFLVVGLGIDLRPLFKHYSTAVVHSAIKGLVESSASLELIKKVQSLTTKPVYTVAAPLKALSVSRFGELYPEETLSYEYQAFLVSSFFKEHRACFLKQPKETRCCDWLTDNRFSKGSTRLIQGTAHPDEDVTHMNYEFGQLLVDKFLENLNLG